MKKGQLYTSAVVIGLGIVAFSLIDHFLIEPRRSAGSGTPELILGNSFAATLAHAVCVSLTLVVGVALYRLRCRRPAVYGQMEILSGLGAALFAANQLTAGIVLGTLAPATLASAVFAELAAFYVIVRGLDNIHQSLKGTSKHAWERFFYGDGARA